MVGQTISHYRLTEKLGEGGMGVVYKAEDTKLRRPVSLKFLAAHLLGDSDVRSRFTREAEAAAALNHPNICHVYEIDEVEGKTFIAMAFLEGEGLDKKIEAGPLKLKQALDVAIQTAKGLQAAHSKGIVHRDIKPANLMIGPDGHVTIMDFGLAQLADRSKLTRMDETMGTVTYMSPEQTYGMDLDHRTDIWSLGVVIYEMVTGQQPFKGHYDKAVMYSITNEEPEPMTALRTGVPMELELLVNKCLAKEANRRYQTTADMVVDLETLSDKFKSGKSTIMPAASAQIAVTGAYTGLTHVPAQAGPLAKYRVIEDIQESDDAVKYLAEDTELHRSVAIRVLPQAAEQEIERSRSRERALVLAVGALGALLAMIFGFLWFSSPDTVPQAPLRRFTLPTNGTPGQPAISPNGRHVAYITGPRNNRILWVQDLDQNQPRPIVGPTNLDSSWPFWSPDSQFVGFRVENRGAFQKVAVSGGPVATLAEAGGVSPRSAWTPDGDWVVFTSQQKLFKISSRGGEPELWLEAEKAGAYEPAFFSIEEGAEKLLYMEVTSQTDVQIIALDRSSGHKETLAKGTAPAYDPSGYVLYVSVDPPGIWAIPFSVDTMQATGNPFRVSENSTAPSVSSDGTLVYREGQVGIGLQRLVWVDREGNRLGTIGQPQIQIRYPALSPDQKRVAVWGSEDDDSDIWIHEVDRPVKTRLTAAGGTNLWPTWSPAGDRIAFASARTGERDLYVQKADGSGEATPLLLTENASEFLTDWSKDENTLLFWRRSGGGVLGVGDIFYLKRTSDGSYEEFAFQKTEFEETTPQFSPDERFIAYTSDESGEREIYIQAFPEGGNKRRVSVKGGTQPRWRADGKELFYVEGESLMAVPVATSPSLTVGTPEALFSAPLLAFENGNFLSYDVTPDGTKFVIRETVDAETKAQPVIRVVENWYEGFRDRERD